MTLTVLLSAVIVLAIVGVVLYCLNVLVPMDTRIKQVINAIALLLVFLWLLGALTGRAVIPLR